MRKTILIVDDEADIRNLVKEILADEGYATLTAANSKEAYAILETEKPDMAVLDIWLQDSRHDGLQILETIKDGPHAHIPAIMISGHGTIETAVSAIKRGAYDFIEKPFKSDRLILMVRRGLEAASLQQENIALKKQSRAGRSVDIIGASSHAKALREQIKMLGASSGRLMIEGPLGAEKTTIARLIHDASARAHEPFVVYVCAAEAQIRGSIAGAVEEAGVGTLVFHGIHYLDKAEQKELLKIVQNESLLTRIVATSQDSHTLDETLYQRIALKTLTVPSLETRKQDIPAILETYIQQVSLELGVRAPNIAPDALKLCEKYSWGGNMYELQAAVIWALAHCGDGNVIDVDALPQRITGRALDADNVEILHSSQQFLHDEVLELPLREAREVFEREYLTSQVERFEGNISKTAQFIGMERSALHRKIKSLQDKEIQVGEPDAQAASNHKGF